MKTTIKIEQIYYHGEATGSYDFNAKALYNKNNKTYLAHIYVDFFNRYIHIAQNQPKECKVLKGLGLALNEFANNNNWILK